MSMHDNIFEPGPNASDLVKLLGREVMICKLDADKYVAIRVDDRRPIISTPKHEGAIVNELEVMSVSEDEIFLQGVNYRKANYRVDLVDWYKSISPK